MQQFTQKLKNGEMQILEVPVPSLQKGQLLVKNHYSLISAGTEGSTVKAARKGYLGKARERPQQVKQVIDSVKSQGVMQTYKTVMNKLDFFSPLGYSCVGEVIDLAEDVETFKRGDLVACAGSGACHAEIVSVHVNLCVKLNKDIDLKSAVYNTLGSIALQGVRQAELQLGETCAVIGLGLIGQLTALLLKASGVRVIGIDINQFQVGLASSNCVDLALQRNTDGIENRLEEFTNGYGCDAVIITAGSKSLDPINFAGTISRKKGIVVVVGAVPTGFDREPHYYNKELILKMSCSYGPGRYDNNYELKGLDYPYAYVRWTENRNMQAFQDLIYTKKIDLKYLTTHVFKLNEAPAAYDMIMAGSELFVGILIEYDTEKPTSFDRVHVKGQSAKLGKINIGFLGAGSYAQKALLPNIPKTGDVILKGVMTSSSSSSRSVAGRFGFEFCTGNEDEIFQNDEINTVFVATRHDSHAHYVKKALESDKHVFVEKPLCMNEDELNEIKEIYNTKLTSQNKKFYLMVGFNRRFSPLTELIKESFPGSPKSMIYRINAGHIPKNSWIQDPGVGGGRILGEVCHFIDYLTYINGSLPSSIYASCMNDANNTNDTLNISINYENGSVGTVSYFANGSKLLPKEYVEIYSAGITAVMNDYKELRIYGSKKIFKKKLMSQDKGQKNEVSYFINTILKGGVPIIPIDEIFNTTITTMKVVESLKSMNRIII